jgi:hypothetical protein
MVQMMSSINQASFGGRQVVTCYTCHRGSSKPRVTPSLAALYGSFPLDDPDEVVQAPGAPPASQILDKYIQALGGAQRLASLTSFVATGNAVGYGDLGGNADFTMLAKMPNQRATLITYKDTQRPASVWAFDGRSGWIKTPRGLLGEYDLIGSELDGARLEAQLSFPGQIKQVLDNWRGAAIRSLGDRDLLAVQGSGPRGFLATLYFDPASGLLLRMVRYGPSPIGRMPTQIDYADYRDVGGIKFPFRVAYAWLDGRDAIQLNEVQTNVPIDAARFGRPAPLK